MRRQLRREPACAQQEAIDNGCEQVLFLDAVERRWVEELGGMNLWFVLDDGTVVTPELTGTILEGVTRDTMKTLAAELGHDVEERRVDIDEWRKGVDAGQITEVFACGTAAVITSVGTLRWHGGEVDTADRDAGRRSAANGAGRPAARARAGPAQLVAPRAMISVTRRTGSVQCRCRISH